ncbi:hypothetical protein HYR69_04755 [Candidatus Sumerlaeota bacterium]|nr:hypothetical protein [Candidatus Sumerlaeota bacterium]
MGLKEKLITVCKRHVLRDRHGATLAEPYIPYVPKHWNGVLVLAEAQNHAGHDNEYLAWLRRLPSKQRLLRLYQSKDMVGVRPWDDGHLKLALEAAFKFRADRTAVSNAVLWSLVSGGTNKNPSTPLRTASVAAWQEMLKVLKPKCIVTAGKVAENIINAVKKADAPVFWCHVPIGSASRRALSPVSGKFDENDLRQYPQVRRAIKRNPQWLEGGYEKNKKYFACQVVRKGRAMMDQLPEAIRLRRRDLN